MRRASRLPCGEFATSSVIEGRGACNEPCYVRTGSNAPVHAGKNKKKQTVAPRFPDAPEPQRRRMKSFAWQAFSTLSSCSKNDAHPLKKKKPGKPYAYTPGCELLPPIKSRPLLLSEVKQTGVV